MVTKLTSVTFEAAVRKKRPSLDYFVIFTECLGEIWALVSFAF